MDAFITKEWLLSRLNDGQVRVVDCRFQLMNPAQGKEWYDEHHIPGAVYFDLNQNLAGEVQEHGGRHPIPTAIDFKHTLEQAGITNETTIIAYDHGGEAFSTRMWWLCKYFGHERVAVLDGGYKGWIEAGFPVTTEIPVYEQSEYEIKVNADMLASYEEVKAATISGDVILVDSRDESRYLGITEPIDRKAGHIPTAVNYVWTEAFEAGHFKEAHLQEKRFEKFEKDKPIIVYCGSGVTATPNYIALQKAGYNKIKLYAGSYSDWVSYDENEVVTRAE